MLPHLQADGQAKSVRTAKMVQRGQLEEMDVAKCKILEARLCASRERLWLLRIDKVGYIS